MRKIMLFSAIAMLATACADISPERAAERCEDRARKAQAPTGGITIGANSQTGAFSSAKIGVSSDFLRGRDPLQVYETCVIELTGEMPIRPPVLRTR